LDAQILSLCVVVLLHLFSVQLVNKFIVVVWNPLLSYSTYPALDPLNLVYALVIISSCMCEDYPNLKMEAAGSCLPNYEASHPKRSTAISRKCTYRRAPIIRSERIISCHLSLRKKTGNYQGVSRFAAFKPR